LWPDLQQEPTSCSNTRQITDSLRNFGVSPKTSSLLLVRFSPAGSDGAQVAKDMEELIEGEPIGLDELGQEGITDWNVVRKVGLSLFRLHPGSLCTRH
jgi:hypothetical protein